MIQMLNMFVFNDGMQMNNIISHLDSDKDIIIHNIYNVDNIKIPNETCSLTRKSHVFSQVRGGHEVHGC